MISGCPLRAKHASFRRLAALALLLLAAGCSEGDDPIGGHPSAPSELTAEGVGISTIRVSWRPSEDPAVTGYELQRRADLTGNFETLETSVATSGAGRVVYFDTKVEPDRYYGYRVRALTQLGGRSDVSNVSGSKTSSLPGLSIRTATEVATPDAVDVDGFQVVVRGRSDTSSYAIGLNSTRLISPLAAGPYTVVLRGLAANCATTVASDTLTAVTITNEGVATVKEAMFLVSCRDPKKASIVTTMRITGDTLDADGVTITASGIIRAPDTPASERSYFRTLVLKGATGSVRFDNLRPGDYEITMGDVESPCVADGAQKFTLQPKALSVDTVRFALTCRKPIVPEDTVGKPFVLRHRWASATARPGDRIALLTSIDLSSQPTQQIGGVSGDINFDPAVVRYDSARTTRAFDVTIVNKLTAGAISFSAFTSGATGLVGNIDVVRTWYTVVGSPGAIVSTSTRLGDVLTPQVTFLNSKTRVSEGTLNIVAGGTTNQSPTAVITGPSAATTGTSVSFSGANSTDADGTIASYAWSFGDNGTGTGATVSHTYASVGSFTVRLTVTDNGGATATRDLPFTVTAPSASVGTVSGVVSSPTRGPLASVTVTVAGGGTAQSSVSGAFTITGVAAGLRSLTLSGLPSGCTTPSPQTVTVAEGAVATANFSVVCTAVGGTTGTVTGKVTRGSGGAGIAGATVLLQPTNGVALGAVTTSIDGSYSVANVPIGAGTGSVSVTNLPVGCATPSSLPYTGLTAGGSVTVDASVTCTTITTGSVTGVVTRSTDGSAIAGATVTLTPTGGVALPAVTTSASGAFTVSNVSVGGGNIAVGTLPTGCTNPGAQAYTGVTAGASVTRNITVTCTVAPVGYPVSLEYGPITTGGPTGRQVQIRVIWNVAAVHATGLSFNLGYDGTKLALQSRQFTSGFDFGAHSVAGAATTGALLSAAYGSVAPSFETGTFTVVAFTFNIATGFTGSITPTLVVTEAVGATLTAVITAQTTVTPPSALVVP